MFNFPYISLPEYFTRLLASNIPNSTYNNSKLESYLNENKELNVLIKKIFRDIDPDGFLEKILAIAGWIGIRNRLAAVYVEYAITGSFPEIADLSLISDIVNIENKLRHFTTTGLSRAFLLGFYAKMALIHIKKSNDGKTPLVIRDEHLEFMKWSKNKSMRIDWLILQLIQFDHYLGTERLSSFLKSGTNYEFLYTLLSSEEQLELTENCLAYGASINDSEIFLNELSV